MRNNFLGVSFSQSSYLVCCAVEREKGVEGRGGSDTFPSVIPTLVCKVDPIFWMSKLGLRDAEACTASIHSENGSVW